MVFLVSQELVSVLVPIILKELLMVSGYLAVQLAGVELCH